RTRVLASGSFGAGACDPARDPCPHDASITSRAAESPRSTAVRILRAARASRNRDVIERRASSTGFCALCRRGWAIDAVARQRAATRRAMVGTIVIGNKKRKITDERRLPSQPERIKVPVVVLFRMFVIGSVAVVASIWALWRYYN